MGKTKIEWAHYSFNPWWGCVRVSEACRNCYAEAFSKRTGNLVWGPTARRRFFGEKHWAEPLKWNRKARAAGERHRVFCASMADVFEELPVNHPDREAMAQARLDLWHLIDATPDLDWLLLTKRPENIRQHAPWSKKARFLRNVWLGTTAESQRDLDERAEILTSLRASIVFLSCEPLLGPLDLDDHIGAGACMRDAGWGREPPWIDWVICGGESGHGARAMRPEWARSLRDQCQEWGVPFHFKQWGDHDEHGKRVGKKAAGRLLDGRTWDELPKVRP